MAPLYLDELSIFCTLTGNLPQPREHVLAHMGHDQSFRLQLVQVSHQGLKIQVKLDFLLKKVGLCNQEVGSFGRWNEGLRPLGIASIGDCFPVALHAQGEGRVSSGMLHAVGGDNHAAQCVRLIECELAYLQCELLLDLGGARKEDVHRCHYSALRARGPHDDEWTAPFAHQLGIQHKKGDAPEMISM